MKPQPSVLILSAVAAAGALLLGCEGGITQIGPGVGSEKELVAAYVDPITPVPAGRAGQNDGGDRDNLPIIDGDGQDKEWSVAQPLFVYVSGDHAMGGDGFYVELRAVWSDESRFADPDNPDPLFKNFLYMLVRYADETFDVFPDYWRYARPGQLGLVASPAPANGDCDSVIVQGENWFIENEGGQEDQVSLMFEIEPASDGARTYSEAGCQIACHGATFGAVQSGRLDVWTWRAGRTNIQESTVYPDEGRWLEGCEDCGIPATRFERLDPVTNWPGYMEDMWADASGLHNDQASSNYPPAKNRYSGQLYVRNAKTGGDGLPIPNFITEKEKSDKPSTGGNEEEVDLVNHGFPKIWFLWGVTATNFTDCDTVATSRLASVRNGPVWSKTPIPPVSNSLPLLPGETDVMPGYALFIPNGSAADVRAKGDHSLNQNKRFSVWTVEVRRPMMTGPSNTSSRSDDVSIDPANEYTFTIAVFNRSSQIHSGSGPLKLKFSPSLRAAQGGRSAS
jgi:hypothetical protein